MTELFLDNPLLSGSDAETGLVAVEPGAGGKANDRMVLFSADPEGGRSVREEAFEPWLLATGSVLDGCPVAFEPRPMQGAGTLDTLVVFGSWRDYLKARQWLTQTTGFAPSAPKAPYYVLNDPVQQYLMLSGKTLFKGMRFGDVRRLQFDIECYTTPGFEFCNPDRADDRIIAIALSDSTGWSEVLSGAALDEKAILEAFMERVRARDPDVIEGHNVFNFDFRYLLARAARHKVQASLGRDGSVPRVRPSRLGIAERTLAYDRVDIFGRHVVDTLFLLQAYDISRRSLPGYGLKDAAIHFGLASKSRTYIEGADISRVFDADPERLMRYVRDDVLETRGLSDLLSQSSFVQAQMLPFGYQNVCVRGNAVKIDALMVREYLRRMRAVPQPHAARRFEGGYTDMFVTGVVENVHHCDIRSLYPSLMLTLRLGPASDDAGAFLAMLDELRTFRLNAKQAMRQAEAKPDRDHYDALQATFKILINSFYGYLGFSQARFSDFDVAARVTREGRDLLRGMIGWLRQHGAAPIEIDTDGVYFVPPANCAGTDPRSRRHLEAFRRELTASLPEGIEIEFDGEYRSMFSYKMKNYALLSDDGEILIKGAALKSRGLEPFQRSFLEELIRFKLQERDHEIQVLKQAYAEAITSRQWPIQQLAKTETLQESPRQYAAKRDKGKTARRAVYELALQSERDYRAGDQVSYYVTGGKKRVVVHEAARLVSDWDPAHRDENVPYYLDKLEALYEKFGAVSAQTELAL